MELLDVVDENGNPTGEIVEREKAHALGIRHRTAHIWITRVHDGEYQVLLQKRAAEKESYPLCYDTSSAGHISAGDEPLETAMRELHEELGIKAYPVDLAFAGTFHVRAENKFHGKLFLDNEVPFVFVYKNEIDVSGLTLQKEEVDSVKWFDLNYIISERKNKNPLYCVSVDSLNLLKESLPQIQKLP